MAEIKVTRINHVGIPISDRAKTLPFYRDILGLNIIASQVDNANVIWTQLNDGAMIHPIEPAEGQERNPASWHVAFQVDVPRWQTPPRQSRRRYVGRRGV